MKKPAKPEGVTTVGVVGGGTIGSGWAAHFLAKGLDVIAADPGPSAERKIRDNVSRAWPSLEKLGLSDGASPDRLIFCDRIDERLANAEFVQESTPERIDLKVGVMKEIEQFIADDVIIASSASYLMPTNLQKNCRVPGRVIIGHPFHPLYLLPLVEVVGGKETSGTSVEWALQFYEHFGQKPLHCEKEVLGHIGNRLQRALYAEALRLFADGVGTTADIDEAICQSAGMRLALFGPFFSRAMAGGADGPKKVFEMIRNAKVSFPFEADCPELTDELIDQLSNEIIDRQGAFSTDELQRSRDGFLVKLRLLLDETSWPRP